MLTICHCTVVKVPIVTKTFVCAAISIKTFTNKTLLSIKTCLAPEKTCQTVFLSRKVIKTFVTVTLRRKISVQVTGKTRQRRVFTRKTLVMEGSHKKVTLFSKY